MPSTQPSLPQALAALRTSPIPAGPPAALVAGTLAQLRALSPSPAWCHRRRSILRAVAIAAVLTLLISVGLWGSFTPTASAFTHMQEKVQQAQNVTCIVKAQLYGWNMETRLFLQGDHIRQEEIRREYTGSLMNVSPKAQEKEIIIIDAKQRKSLSLFPGRKEAKEYPLAVKGNDPPWPHPVAQLRVLPTAHAERVSQENIKGRPTEVYRVSKATVLGITSDAEHQFWVWVDKNTKLPVKVEVRATGSNETVISFEEMVWNQQLDPKLFSLTPPPGYTLLPQER